MNRYISHWFLKMLLLYILNLNWKLHLLIQKFLQKGQCKGPKKVRKMYILQIEKNIPIFSKWIDILCAVQNVWKDFVKSPFFSEWIDIFRSHCSQAQTVDSLKSNEEGLCYHTHSAPNESIYFEPQNTIYWFIWREMCVITHSFLKSVRFWRIWAFFGLQGC